MLLQGSKRARAECQRTLQEAREAMGLSYFRQLKQVDQTADGGS